MAEHYAAAGVSLEAGYKSVELIKEHVKKTMRPEVLGGLGGFSGAFSLSKIKDMEEPVLLSGTETYRNIQHLTNRFAISKIPGKTGKNTSRKTAKGGVIL